MGTNTKSFVRFFLLVACMLAVTGLTFLAPNAHAQSEGSASGLSLGTQSSGEFCAPPKVYLDGSGVTSEAPSVSLASQTVTSGYGTLDMVRIGTWSSSARIYYKVITEKPEGFSGSLESYVDATSLYQTTSNGFRPQAPEFTERITLPMGESYVKYVALDEQSGFDFLKRSNEFVIRINRVFPKLAYSCNVDQGTVSGTTPAAYDVGTQITVKATPAEGYEFVQWVDSYSAKTVSSAAEYSFVLDKTTSLTAQFKTRTGVAIDEANFPDAAFRAFVKSTYDANKDSWLSASESAQVTQMKCTNKGIVSIQGIENFPALETLNVSTNQITAVDISSLSALEVFMAGSNQIMSVNLGANTSLKELNLDSNRLVALDVSKLSDLTKLLVYNNDLDSLDVGGNPLLSNLQCYGNEFVQLDLRSNDYLKGAVLEGTKDASSSNFDKYTRPEGEVFTTLLVDKNVALTCEDGVAIDEANFPDAAFRSFVAEYDTNNSGVLTEAEIAAVTSMDCSSKGIGSLEGIGYFTALVELVCSKNELTALDISKNTALTILDCLGNKLSSLDLGTNTQLEWLNCSGNELTSLDLSKHAALDLLKCTNNKLATLKLAENGALNYLECYGNQLEVLDVSAVPALKSAVEAGDPEEVEGHLWYASALGSMYADKSTLVSVVPVPDPTPDPDPDPDPTPDPDPDPNPDPTPTPVVKKASTIAIANQTSTYTGAPIAYKGKVSKTGSTGKVSYTYFSDAACTKRIAASSVKNVGTYYVRATVGADTNYNAATSKAAKIVVKKAAAKVVAKPVAKKNLKYTGKAQTLVSAGKTSGGAMRYSLDGKTWSAKLPAAKKAGTYTVRYKVVATDANHASSATGSLKVKIAKAKNTLAASGKKVAVAAAKVVKKSQAIVKTKAFTVKKAQGSVTYKVTKYVTKKAKGKIAVSKAGKVTVKKGTPKGTYILNVRITAAGNANYNKTAKTTMLKVVVK